MLLPIHGVDFEMRDDTMLLRATLLAFVFLAGCSAEDAPSTSSNAASDREYDFDDWFTEADLQEIETLVKSRTDEPIIQYKVTSSTSVDVRCGELTGSGSIVGRYFVLRKRSGRWHEERSGDRGIISCGYEDIFGDRPADALAAIPSSPQR